MRILLIYPSTLENGKPSKFRRAYLPPLNLAILDRLTELTNPKHEVRIVNDCVEAIDFDMDCDMVGITALTSQVCRAYQIADLFRSKGKTVVLGGVHPSLMPHEAIGHADSVIIGEAENVWSDVLFDFETRSLKTFYQRDNFVDLSNLMLPKWDNMNLSIYRRSYRRKLPRMPIYTTRGCVHNCKYCSVSKFFGRTYRNKPIRNVLKEIEKTGAESYFFTDDNIICNPDYSELLFKALKSKSLGIRWISQCSTNILKKPRLINLAAEAGCRSMIFGIESINKENLKSVKKGFNNPEKYVELHRRCSKNGIQPWFSMIFGMDNDTPESMAETVNYLKTNGIYNVVFWILTPLPGTDLYAEMSESGRILDSDWSKYDLNHVVFKPNHFAPEDLQANFWKAFKSLYSLPFMAQRALYVLRNSDRPFTNLMTSITNQFFIRKQLSFSIHPYSMGISRTK